MIGDSYYENYQVNENISENYLKVLKEDHRTTEILKERLRNKGDVLVDMASVQNKKVLVHSSKVYEDLMDQYEQFNEKLIDLDITLEDVVIKQKEAVRNLIEKNKYYLSKKNYNSKPTKRPSSSNNKNYNTGYSDLAIKEFDRKIEELKKLNKISEDKITLEKGRKDEYESKAKDVIDYTSKFNIEKRLYLDKVEEERLRDLSKKFIYFIILFYIKN